MAKLNGNLFRIYAEDTEGSGNFSEIAYLIDTGYTEAHASIDASNKTDGHWACRITGGQKTSDVSGTAVVASGDPSRDKIKTIARSETQTWLFRIDTYDLNGTTLVERTEGNYLVTEYAPTGTVNDLLSYTLTLESTGEPTFT